MLLSWAGALLEVALLVWLYRTDHPAWILAYALAYVFGLRVFMRARRKFDDADYVHWHPKEGE